MPGGASRRVSAYGFDTFGYQGTVGDTIAREARSDAFTFSSPAIKASPDMLVSWLRASQIFAAPMRISHPGH